ncbi:MAG: nucleoside hydrolase [Anaerolineales bacterium]|nr:nucleoside hydrolase [Anaerolineales bacterium]MBP6210268.1 nucleoside hydrolase [Anaerolineales bacterium]
MKRRIILDTDPGIDDSLAILLALASPEISLEGLSVVHGNSSTAQGTVNALSVLELAKAEHIPVYAGCELPLVQPSLLAPETHGEHGIGYAKLPEPLTRPQSQNGCDFLIDKIMSNPGEMTLVAIGPLTNIALALRQEPRIAKNVKEVFIMGGAIRHEGNTTPLAEFNTYVDPHAAHMVFHSGMPITLTPLDVTYDCIFLKEDLNRLLKTASPITSFIADATRFYMEFHDEYQHIEGCVINDPMTMALTFMPEICDYQELYVDVDLSGGVSMGSTFADFYRMTQKPANMKVALGVRPRVFMELFMERMEKLAKSLT